MAQYARGIAPETLITQVQGTMPYVFEVEPDSELARFEPVKRLRTFAENPPAAPAPDTDETLTHEEYFKLCVSAHYSSCGSLVPTDVDNQIRLKLWPKNLPLETALEMARWVIQARAFDYRLVSTRYTYGPKDTPFEKDSLDGHLGEWFTIAVAAYCALKRYSSQEAKKVVQELAQSIRDEVHH
ncbi:MAG: hypothetical protein EOP09_19600, partial [Proteobacteria bacterium]